MEHTTTRLLIIDDDYQICEQLCNYFDATKDFEIVGFASNGLDGYDLLYKTHPDVVLLDLIMPLMDGIGFIEQIKDDGLMMQHKIIVMSAIHEEKYINKVLALGVDHYIIKPFDLNQVEKRVRKIMSEVVPIRNKPTTPTKSFKQEKKPTQSQDISSTISRMLIDSGLPVHTLGYKYFQSAIYYLLQQDSDVFSITKTIYPYIAIKYETSSSCVDKAMRHSLSLAHQENQSMLRYFLSQMHYKDCESKPSNSEYLNLSIEKIKQDVTSKRA